MGKQVQYLDQQLFEMFTENTGTHLLDSGGDNGRHWQRNQGRDVDSFINEPQAVLKIEKGRLGYSTEWGISAFHICREGLDFDSLCKRFNSMPVNDWDGEYYGVSAMYGDCFTFFKSHILLLLLTTNCLYLCWRNCCCIQR